MSKTVVVFQKDCILAAGGREGRFPNLSWVKRIPVSQENSFHKWQRALEELEEERKIDPICLVLPTSLCSARILQLPYTRGRQMIQMAEEAIKDTIYDEVADYTVIYQDKKVGFDICAGSVNKSVLERFIETCQEADISIDSITVPIEGYLKVLRQLDSYWNSTAIYLFLEEGAITSFLCQNGRHLYSERSCLLCQPGTLNFSAEVMETISGILRFYTGKGELPVTEVYYVGCSEKEFEICVEDIENVGLNALPLELDGKILMPDQEKTADWISCIGAMIYDGKREKEIDLYSVRLDMDKKKKTKNIFWQLVLPAMILLLGLLSAGAITFLNCMVSMIDLP